MSDHYTKEDDIKFVKAGPDEVEEARKLHHLATADPEPERDGLMTGPAHEEKYGLERADASAEHWRSRGVDPKRNVRLDDGDKPETAEASKAPENAAAKRAK
jgi:hypothetical protein